MWTSSGHYPCYSEGQCKQLNEKLGLTNENATKVQNILGTFTKNIIGLIDSNQYN